MAVTALGKFLRKTRIESDSLLRDMAEELGVSSAQLSAIELGKRAIKPDLVGQIIKLYSSPEFGAEFINKIADESQPSCKISLQDVSSKQRETMVMFARGLGELPDDKLEQIQRLLMD